MSADPNELEVCRRTGCLARGAPRGPGGRWALGSEVAEAPSGFCPGNSVGVGGLRPRFQAWPALARGAGAGRGEGKATVPCGRDSGQLPGPHCPHHALLRAPPEVHKPWGPPTLGALTCLPHQTPTGHPSRRLRGAWWPPVCRPQGGVALPAPGPPQSLWRRRALGTTRPEARAPQSDRG